MTSPLVKLISSTRSSVENAAAVKVSVQAFGGVVCHLTLSSPIAQCHDAGFLASEVG